MRGIALVLLVLFVGCAGVSKEKKQAELNTLNNGLSQCTQYTSQPFSTFITCSNTALNQYLINTKYPYMDLIQFYVSYSMAVANRVDLGEISPMEAHQILSAMRFQIIQVEKERDFQRYQKRMSMIQIWQNAFNVNYNQNITCIQTGNIITCN